MLVYGDTQERVATFEFLSNILGSAERLLYLDYGRGWHQACVELFIDLASLLQGVADREREALGYDELSLSQQRLMEALRSVAGSIDQSWRSGFECQSFDQAWLTPLSDLSLPGTVTVKRCEGYAFYALYPETYLEAARALPPDCFVVGLRSIGTGLAALAAAACGATDAITLRPCGHPFSRSLRAGPRLEHLVRSNASKRFVIADEGPGLSGSSFGGVADWLEGLGVACERITFLPSHEGDLGPNASPEHRRRWARAERRVKTFEQLFDPSKSPTPLHAWFEDVTGELTEAPEELSGGVWTGRRQNIPTDPMREARKLLLRGKKGSFILKFAGLDRPARAKFERARQLHRAGFCLEPIDMRYGFMIERYVSAEGAADVPASHLIDYCAFRRDRLPAKSQGATLAELVAMARHNLGEAAPGLEQEVTRRWSDDRIAALQPLVVPVHIDGRLQWWEWLRSGGRIMKTDAVDHSQSHDLVGCQDILWDVAGAMVELGAGRDGEEELAGAFVKEDSRRRELLRLMQICYLTFQLGWWSLSSTAAGLARSRWYRGKAELALAG